MQARELRDKSTTELHEILASSRAKLQAHRLDARANRLTGVRSIRVMRRSIARLATILKERSQAMPAVI